MANLWEGWRASSSFRQTMSGIWEGMSTEDRVAILRNRGMDISLADYSLPSLVEEIVARRRYSDTIMERFLRDLGNKAMTIENQLGDNF